MQKKRPNSQGNADPRLSLRGGPRPGRLAILASHLVFMGYAHWLPNDLRGSGSETIRNANLEPLGEILPGRQYPQPPRVEVREFFDEAEAHLEHPRIWFRESARETIAYAFRDAAKQYGYTLWACAICSNHAHVVVRTHRDHSEEIWTRLAQAAKAALLATGLAPQGHPVWSHRPYKVFLRMPDEVRGRIDYVNDNPEKEGLARQHWDFVEEYALKSSAKGKRRPGRSS